MNKRNFFMSMLSGENGISSKRSVMVFFVLLFAFTVIYNMITGKGPDDIYKSQLFELVIISLVAVFGEKITETVQSLKGKKDSEQPKT